MLSAASEFRNRILSALSPAELSAMKPHLQWLDVRAGTVLVDGPPGDLYFPETAVISLRRNGTETRAPHIGMVGSEGFVGASPLLGVFLPFDRAIALNPGMVIRVPSQIAIDAIRRSAEAESALKRFVAAQVDAITVSLSCVSRHAIVQRCAREILLLHDRAKTDELPLTHVALAEMLGVRRPSVTVAAEALRRKGAISYARKVLRLVDRERLEMLACPCYSALRSSSGDELRH